MRQNLTSEIVDSFEPPIRGERWIGDLTVKGLGVRLWSNGKEGNAAYAIRVRDEEGVIRRETFSVWSNWWARNKALEILRGGETPNLGAFLPEARAWAIDRIRILKGGKDRLEAVQERRSRVSAFLQSLTLEETAERVLKKLERREQNDAYVIQLRKLLYRLSDDSRSTSLMRTDICRLAAEIAEPSLPIFQSRTLQSFVGQMYQTLSRWHGQADRKHAALIQRISRLRSRQGVPHPEILAITDADFEKVLQTLANEGPQWRSALALRLYFTTGAKLRRVLSARWDQIIDHTWYPYSPDEREYWFMGAERLDEAAQDTLRIAKERLASEDRSSDYVFPAVDTARIRPITTIRRYWLKLCSEMGWEGLPLSHVVQRYNERNTPSYIYMYRHLFVPMRRAALDPDIVSKIVNRAKLDLQINNLAGHGNTSQNLRG